MADISLHRPEAQNYFHHDGKVDEIVPLALGRMFLRPQNTANHGSTASATSSKPILNLYERCIGVFYIICSSDVDSDVSWKEELGRFRAWSSNNGVQQQSDESLDNRLRHSSHIHTSVKILLETILENLRISMGLCSLPEAVVPEASSNDNVPILSDSDDVTLEECLSTITEAINDLYDITPYIMGPSLHDRIYNTEIPSLMTFTKDFDVRHVRDKFNNASENLADRLGVANCRRRILLSESRVRSETMRTLSKSTVSESGQTFHDSGLGTSLPASLPLVACTTSWTAVHDEDDEPRSNTSETSYALTVSAELHNDRRRVPRPPSALYEGMPFDCPYCGRSLRKTKSFSAWKTHVFRDLRPYICTFGACVEGNRLFERRSQWINHESEVHRISWVCNDPECNRIFATEGMFYEHLLQHHSSAFGKRQLAAISDLCKRKAQTPLHCPLCRETFATYRVFYKHLASELEEIALFVLPPEEGESDEELQELYYSQDSGEEGESPEASPTSESIKERERKQAWEREMEARRERKRLQDAEWEVVRLELEEEDDRRRREKEGDEAIEEVALETLIEGGKQFAEQNIRSEVRQTYSKHSDEVNSTTEEPGVSSLLEVPTSPTPGPRSLLCPQCGAELRTPSEFKKHRLKHEKPFKCPIYGCERSLEGFQILNDLERHKRSKHKIFPSSGEVIVYKCASEKCIDKTKIWYRLDNFSQHLDRMHSDQDRNDLVNRSKFVVQAEDEDKPSTS